MVDVGRVDCTICRVVCVVSLAVSGASCELVAGAAAGFGSYCMQIGMDDLR